MNLADLASPRSRAGLARIERRARDEAASRAMQRAAFADLALVIAVSAAGAAAGCLLATLADLLASALAR